MIEMKEYMPKLSGDEKKEFENICNKLKQGFSLWVVQGKDEVLIDTLYTHKVMDVVFLDLNYELRSRL